MITVTITTYCVYGVYYATIIKATSMCIIMCMMLLYYCFLITYTSACYYVAICVIMLRIPYMLIMLLIL